MTRNASFGEGVSGALNAGKNTFYQKTGNKIDKKQQEEQIEDAAKEAEEE